MRLGQLQLLVDLLVRLLQPLVDPGHLGGLLGQPVVQSLIRRKASAWASSSPPARTAAAGSSPAPGP